MLGRLKEPALYTADKAFLIGLVGISPQYAVPQPGAQPLAIAGVEGS